MGLREMFFGKKPHEEFDLTDTKPGSSPTGNAENWHEDIKKPEPGPSIDTKNALKDLKEQLKASGQEKKPTNFPDGSQKIPLIEDPDLLQEITDEDDKEEELTEADLLDVRNGK
ncbi:MAG: hypothetical protein A2534_01245 [Candidatus Magasanikbacteria bacterium RIFOXYD2_FULL_39_9]|uniref:Uncharacterized protein n=1 Tax=Candidatus Magasanikbacteria bacterium RIFOXYD1_FULL_40_23 TaxID=1798705 RepID=A0A1F6P9P3_9BACT|nr:MAG: hypothetical protein A2534_01245 [Candidatus Magasanikbacteria bacterium RIFOXYD2_FULL_39_9]OGH92654.1 MAG: hypothetical protein A2563_03195 [Candidatus Magasanikbacteria bacterium RIFOXYD1_FULL_40_23]